MRTGERERELEREKERERERKKLHIWEWWEWHKEPGLLSSVFLCVCSAGEEKIKVETLLLKLGTVEEAATSTHQHTPTETHSELSFLKVREYQCCSDYLWFKLPLCDLSWHFNVLSTQQQQQQQKKPKTPFDKIESHPLFKWEQGDKEVNSLSPDSGCCGDLEPKSM